MHDKKLVSKSEACYSIHSSSDEDPVRIRFLICGDLRIPYLGLIYYCFFVRNFKCQNAVIPSQTTAFDNGEGVGAFAFRHLYFEK